MNTDKSVLMVYNMSVNKKSSVRQYRTLTTATKQLLLKRFKNKNN